MTIGHQLIAVSIDQQLKYIITSTLTKTLEALRWHHIDDFIKLDIETVIDIIYSYLSFYPETVMRYLSPLAPSLFNGSSSSSTVSTPGMRVTGLRWEERGNSLLYMMSLIGYTVLTQLRKVSLIEGQSLSYSYMLHRIISFMLGWRSEEEGSTEERDEPENTSISAVDSSTTEEEEEERRRRAERKKKRFYYDVIKYLLAAVKCSSIINYLFFFITGDYPTLAYRIAGFKMVNTAVGWFCSLFSYRLLPLSACSFYRSELILILSTRILK